MTQPRYFGSKAPGLPSEELPGRLIVIEGTDGVGRSTQVALLREWLEAQGYAVTHTGLRRSDLTGPGIERAKRGHTLDPMTLYLFYATDFADRLERLIIPALRAGMVVLTDRYFYSVVARAVVRGVDRAWMEDVFGFALVPDRVFYLDVDLEHLVPRVMRSIGFNYWESGQDYQGGSDLFQNYVRYQRSLLTEFQRLAEQYDFTVVDARQTIADIFAILCRELQPILDDMARPDTAAHARA
jgi:dTMP kinase